MNTQVRKYFQEIGRKGGKAGKGSPAKRASARRAIAIRWARAKNTQTRTPDFKKRTRRPKKVVDTS